MPAAHTALKWNPGFKVNPPRGATHPCWLPVLVSAVFCGDKAARILTVWDGHSYPLPLALGFVGDK
jgi:hypothetical protein